MVTGGGGQEGKEGRMGGLVVWSGGEGRLENLCCSLSVLHGGFLPLLFVLVESSECQVSFVCLV